MALAGVSEWRIQIFGRWGSQASLKYVRDTLIQGRGDSLAADVEQGLKAGSLAQVVAQATPEQDRALVRQKFFLDSIALDVDAAVGGARQTPEKAEEEEGGALQALKTAVEARLSEIKKEVKALSVRAMPEAVVNKATGVARIVRNSTTACCGWGWGAQAMLCQPAALDQEGQWCRRCCKVADHQQADQPGGVAKTTEDTVAG